MLNIKKLFTNKKLKKKLKKKIRKLSRRIFLLNKYFLTLDRYILKNTFETFLMGLVIFTSIIFASDTLLTLIKQMSLYGMPFNVAIFIVILKLPAVLSLTIPMGVLLSTVMTLNKMSLDSEISVMRACGISLLRIARPVFFFGLVAMLAGFFINELIVPVANTQAKKLTLWALQQKNVPNGTENFTLKELKDGNLKRLFYISKCENNKLYGITVLDLSKNNSTMFLQAKEGKAKKDFWEFENGVIYSINNNGKVLNSTIFGNLDYYSNPDLMSFINEDYEKEMTTLSLVKYIYNHRHSSPKSLALFWMEFYNKWALPMMSLIFVLIGVPLAITPPRVRFNRGFLFSIGVIFSYYILKAIALSLGETCILPAFLATWTPNLVIGSVGAYMFYKKAFRI
jgi:lipopolysaccharide export system permease protein